VSDQGAADQHYSPLALIGVVLLSLLMFALFFISFLVAPLAVLVLFYVGYSATDRGKKRGNGGPPAAPPTGTQPTNLDG